MRRSYVLFLEDIVEAMRDIFEFIEDMSFDDFDSDNKTASAVIRKLEIIGEAAKNLPADFTMKHEGIPWSYMAKMRDKLIHGYFGVDNQIIWEVINKRFRGLFPEIGELLEKEKKQEE